MQKAEALADWLPGLRDAPFSLASVLVAEFPETGVAVPSVALNRRLLSDHCVADPSGRQHSEQECRHGSGAEGRAGAPSGGKMSFQEGRPPELGWGHRVYPPTPWLSH